MEEYDINAAEQEITGVSAAEEGVAAARDDGAEDDGEIDRVEATTEDSNAGAV